ncbi:MAG: glycosyltransferase family 2 protein [Anaerolineae bacterium]|nr:glycosyltransferase family 2 protein [Anaerolineae bacterium]
MVDGSIIIVSWNVADLLEACLRSIQVSARGSPYSIETIVVDSASTDDTVARLRQNFPEVTLLPQSANLGFTRCNNIGLAAATGRYLFLLNPDTELVGDVLPRLIDYLEAHSHVGIIGPHTLNTDGTHQSTRRRFPTLLTAVFESTWLQPLAPRFILDRYTCADVPDDAIAEVDWVQGSALLARRAVYEQIGGLDEGYIMYSEELDWCRRAKAAGWQVIYQGEARIIHHGGRSSEQATTRKHVLFQESKLRYFRKYHGRWSAQVLRIILLLNYLWQIAIESLKSLLGHKRQMRQERIHSYWQVIRSGLKVQ